MSRVFNLTISTNTRYWYSYLCISAFLPLREVLQSLDRTFYFIFFFAHLTELLFTYMIHIHWKEKKTKQNKTTKVTLWLTRNPQIVSSNHMTKSFFWERFPPRNSYFHREGNKWLPSGFCTDIRPLSPR